MADFNAWSTLLVVSTFARWPHGSATELTFKLQDSATECFHELIAENLTSVLEYQVVSGGQSDVDVTLTSPSSDVIHQDRRSQYDLVTFTPATSGVYVVCFHNEYSSYAEKVVYIRLQVGPEPELPGYLDHVKLMALIQASTERIHAKLNDAAGFQTGYRLREPLSTKIAEDLDERLLRWSLAETLAIVVVVVVEVVALRTCLGGALTTGQR